MILAEFESRVVLEREIHELVSTSLCVRYPDIVRDVAYLGFVEFACGGYLQIGDRVTVDGRDIGSLLGFDQCHFPNHLNLIVIMENALTGEELDLTLTSKISFTDATGQ